jgi:ribosome biogenesis protein BMS1
VKANPQCDRDVSLFGYVRGTHLKPSMRIHLIGAGDFDIEGISAINDPCPLPAHEDLNKFKKSSLKKKDTLLYAPLANVGRVQMDQDGEY